MARLSQLAGNLRIVFPPTVTIAVLFTLFQQSLQPVQLHDAVFQNGTEQHPAQFFYLSPPQMFYFPFISSIFSSARVSAERRKASVSSTRPEVAGLSDGGLQPAQRATFQLCDANEVFLTHDRFIMRSGVFYNIVSELRLDVFG